MTACCSMRRSANHLFNVLYDAYTNKSIERRLHHHTRTRNRKVEYVTSVNPQGVRAGDVWHFPFINPAAKERVGYPTQKPLALLTRIARSIEQSRRRGDGPVAVAGVRASGGGAVFRAQWLGIDSNHEVLYDCHGRALQAGCCEPR